MPMTIKLGRVVTYHEDLPPVKSENPLMTCMACEIMQQTKTIMATKLGRMKSYNEDLPLIKSHDSSITWSCEVT